MDIKKNLTTLLGYHKRGNSGVICGSDHMVGMMGIVFKGKTYIGNEQNNTVIESILTVVSANITAYQLHINSTGGVNLYGGKGGIYLDIDCKLISRFRDFVKDSDEAIISIENNGNLYTQWALIFDVGHPFLKRTLELCLINIFEHRYPHDVHQTTGPTVFTHAIKEVLQLDPNTPYREMGMEYEGHIDDKYKLAKFFLYKDRKEHWKKQQLSQDIIKPFE